MHATGRDHLGREPRDPGVPRGLRGGADGTHDVRARPHQRPLIETYAALGALDKLERVVLPLLLGDGMRLTPSLSPDTALQFESERALPGGSVEIVYAVRGRTSAPAARDAGWTPASQR
jgi:hypothetical protein